MRAILASPDFWETAAKLPGSAKAKRRKNGRPAAHPDWLYLYLACVTTIVGTQRSAVKEFMDPVYWRWIVSATEDNPYRKALRLAKLGTTPLARHHMTYFNRRWLSPEYRPFADAAKEAALTVARQAALDEGLLDAAQPMSFQQPDPGDFVRADGTVFDSQTRKGPRGEDGVCRIDAAADLHFVGGDTKTAKYGSKVEFISTRTDDYGSRLILAYDAVTGNTKSGIGNEAAVTMALAHELKDAFPGLRGLIVDSVLRGNHVVELARAGMLVVNHPHALANPNGRESGRFATGRVEKSTKVLSFEHRLVTGGVCRHEVFVSGSNYFLVVLDARGNETQIPVHVQNLKIHHNGDGTTRWYHELVIPCINGDQTVHLPLFHEPRGNTGALQIENRGEYLRVPNRHLDVRLPLRATQRH